MLEEKDIEQAYIEIRDTFADKLLNTEQKKNFVIAILKGQLANPEDSNISKTYEIPRKLNIVKESEILCICGHPQFVHAGYDDEYHNPFDESCNFKCGCESFRLK